MATIKPFAGCATTSAARSQVISQPYDRVRYGLQEQYYDRSPYNVVRIIRGQEMPGDDPESAAAPTSTRALAAL